MGGGQEQKIHEFVGKMIALGATVLFIVLLGRGVGLISSVLIAVICSFAAALFPMLIVFSSNPPNN